MSLATLALPQLVAGVSRRASLGADVAGRTIGYLRMSLTRGCAMRCTYCRPAIDRNPRQESRLSPTQLEQLTRHLVQNHGVRKVRLTGGDPTSRPELLEILRRLAAIPGLDDLAMTTNGLTLARQAGAYAAARLTRLNVSLDTLDRDRFRRITGVDGLRAVLEGIEEARRVGLGPIKLNTVAVRGQNLGDLPGLLDYAADRGLPLRLIELMPMGPLAASWAGRYVPEAELRSILAPYIAADEPLPQGRSAARSSRVTLHDGRLAEVGYITPMSCNFCADCDRLRLGADGSIYPCLMDEPRGHLGAAFEGERLRPAVFDALIDRAYRHKAESHPSVGPAVMTHVGG